MIRGQKRPYALAGLLAACLLCAAHVSAARANSVIHVENPGISAASSADASAAPTDTTPLVALVVDTQRILKEALVAKNIQQQIDTQREKFQSELAKDETRLRDGEQKLIQERDSVSSEEYAKAQMKLREDVEGVDRTAQAKRRVLDTAFADSMQTMRDALQQIVQQMAVAHHVSLVLLRQQVLWSDRSLDVTDDVLAQLNKKLPKLDVKIPDNPAPDNQSDSTLPTMRFDSGE